MTKENDTPKSKPEESNAHQPQVVFVKDSADKIKKK
jgi:hypothetical protein